MISVGKLFIWFIIIKMKLFEIKKAGDGQHKYKAVFCACDGPESRCCAVQKKIILFGAEGYKDYIQYYKNDPAKAEMKKDAYIARHKINEDWTDPMTPGTLSRYILWNLPTFEASLSDFKKKFKM